MQDHEPEGGHGEERKGNHWVYTFEVVKTIRGMSRGGSQSGGTGGPRVEAGQAFVRIEQFGLLDGGELARPKSTLQVKVS
jgi:hypothetical protein